MSDNHWTQIVCGVLDKYPQFAEMMRKFNDHLNNHRRSSPNDAFAAGDAFRHGMLSAINSGDSAPSAAVEAVLEEALLCVDWSAVGRHILGLPKPGWTAEEIMEREG